MNNFITKTLLMMLIVSGGISVSVFAGKSHKPKASKQHAKAYGDDEPVLLDGEPMILNSKKVIKYSKMKRSGYDEKYMYAIVEQSADSVVASSEHEIKVEEKESSIDSDSVYFDPAKTRDELFDVIVLYAKGLIDCDIRVIIEKALDCGFDPNLRGAVGETALHVAAAYNVSDWVETLINIGGCDVMACDNLGNTPLHNAALCNADNAIDVLMYYGNKYYSEVRNDSGSTALHLAAYYNNAAAARMLCERGANIDACDCFGHTAVEIAAMRHGGSHSVFDILHSFMHQYDDWDRKPASFVEKRTHPQLFVDTTRH